MREPAHNGLETLMVDLLPCAVAVADEAGRLLAANHPARVLLGLDGSEPQGIALSCEGRRVRLGELLREHAAGQAPRRRLELDHPELGRLRATLTRVGNGPGGPQVHLVVERGPQRDWRWAGRSDPLMVFAHELGNVLTSLREGLALLAEDVGTWERGREEREALSVEREAQGTGDAPRSTLHAPPPDLSRLRRRLLEGVREDAARMARLTERMAAAGGARAGRVRVAARPVNAGDLAAAVVRSFEATAAKAGVEMALGDSDAGLVCLADADLLTQALGNLVGNALKFTPAGGRVSVTARRREEGGETSVELAVSDTGRGLSAEELAEVLEGAGAADVEREGVERKALSVEREAQEAKDAPRSTLHAPRPDAPRSTLHAPPPDAPRSTLHAPPPDASRSTLHASRSTPCGLGIGLSIVREIAEQHGGRLEGASARGAGSCFRLLVPMDFRRAEPWRLVQIASGLRLAQAVGVPLSVVEIGVSADGGAEDPGAWEGGREGEGESGSVERRASSVERKAQEAKDASRFTLSRSHAHTLSQLMQLPMIEQCLEESLRPSDTVVVGEGSATLVLYGVDAAGARGVADRAVRALARLLGRLPEPRPTCRISVGTASYPADGATASALAEAARRPKEEARS